MWLNSLLVFILLICIYTDLKNRKIYNKVIYPAVLIALASHLLMSGWMSLFYSAIGLCVGLGILLIPYLLGGMGAGDVKLLALVGAIKGSVFVFQTSIYMALIGALMAAFILLFRKGRLRSVMLFLYSRMHKVKAPLILDHRKVYPYGVAIAGGAFICLILNGKFTFWL
jgi:prepilin peptidase CpaA